MKLGALSGIFVAQPFSTHFGKAFAQASESVLKNVDAIEADLVVIGGGLGGCAAALAALRNGLRVVLTEETDWIGGQLTSQGVPPDENPWIETHGSTSLYREFRTKIRDYYRRNYPLKEEFKSNPNLNPGGGSVSRLCHEPRVALAVLYEMFAPYFSTGKLAILLETRPVASDIDGDRVESVTVRNLRTEHTITLKAPYFIDASELGDLLPLTKAEYVRGAESRTETNELHASEKADPENQQAFTVCFAMDYEKGADHRIDKPHEYDFWKNYVPNVAPAWPGKLLSFTYSHPITLEPTELGFHPEDEPTGKILNLMIYRRIINKAAYPAGTYTGDATVANWPQNDYLLGNLDTSSEDFDTHFARAKQLSLSLFYWLQTEAPRPDGGTGWPGLRLRGDLMGTEDGLAKYPYVRESRRIKSLFTVLEEHVGKAQRESVTGKEERFAAPFEDSVGIGYYRIDLHPSSGGDNYIDFASLPYQIPLGAMLPQRVTNLIPACKNIGTTHVTNGNFRLHPVEWGIGEAAGSLVFYALQKKTPPHALRETKSHLSAFQDFIRSQGVLTHWKED